MMYLAREIRPANKCVGSGEGRKSAIGHVRQVFVHRLKLKVKC